TLHSYYSDFYFYVYSSLFHLLFFFFFFFFFNDPATTEFYTLSLHDALPISRDRSSGAWYRSQSAWCGRSRRSARVSSLAATTARDRKSTRLNSSHLGISYAVFCLKKKKKKKKHKKTTYKKTKKRHILSTQL